MTKIVAATKCFPPELQGTFHPIEGMSKKVSSELANDNFLIKQDPKYEDAGMNRDWPAGRGVYHNDDKTFLVWINAQEQVRIISTC